MTKRKLPSTFLLLTVVGLLTALVAGHTAARPRWQQKVDSWVLNTMAEDDELSYLIVLQEQADLSGIGARASKEEKGSDVYARLTEVALRTQRPLIDTLQQAGVEYRTYWISNMIWARGDAALVEVLARRSDVARIHANPWTRLDVTSSPVSRDNQGAVAGPEWNVSLIHAPELWAIGIDGSSAVVGGQDTGYDWTHPALKEQYRGWNGLAADHSYSWHDAIHEDNPHTASGNPCGGFDLAEPCDDRGHGTHTMGTIVGTDGSENLIGVAPGAKWIGCRNMEEGWGTPATYAECYQWFVAPYPYDGDPFLDGDPSKAPDAINNSWSCPISEGCTEPDVLRTVVDNVRAAGIVTVHSASNRGSSCGTIEEPAAIYDASFTVGATYANDAIAGFSSRGPAMQDGIALIKPDVSAPGVSVRSSLPSEGYGTLSGTSMAAPHVVGLVALLVNARPDLAGQVDVLESLIEQSALALYSSEECGDDTVDALPNNVFGWGRIDALAAYGASTSLATPTATPTATSTATPTPSPTNTLVPTWIGPTGELEYFIPILINS